MRLILRLLFLSTVFIYGNLYAQFTPGNLAVFSATSATSNNTSISILEINPSLAGQALPVHFYPIDSTNMATALKTSGSASSTGYLSNSNDGSLVCFTGHNTNLLTPNINTFTARGAGTLNAAGNVAIQTFYTGTSGNQTRCATSINNSTWFIADQGGVYTNSANAASPTGNFRSIRSFGGTVYIFQASNSLPPVGTLSAPTGATFTGLPGLANGSTSLQDFYMISSGANGTTYDVLYTLAATNATTGTISKYSLVAGSWVTNGTYTTTFGGFGMAVAPTGTGASIYITTGTGAITVNSIIKLTDDAGYNASVSITTANNITLYTAAMGTTMKGIAFAPVAVPSPAVSAAPASFNFGTINTGSQSAGQTITLTASNLTPASGTLTVTSPSADFEIFDGVSWGNTTIVNYSNSGATIDNFMTRLNPHIAGVLSANISVNGGGLASALVIPLSGTGANALSFNFSPATTTALTPPYVSGTINDAADPAANAGIILSVQESAVDIPMTDYTVTATSGNASVVPDANISIIKADGNVTIKIVPVSAGYADITLLLSKGTDARNIIIHYAASLAASAAGVWPTGIADASAALAVDDDYMIIGNDESNLLYVYNRNASGLPVKTFDFNSGNILGLTDGSTNNWKELDIEAATMSPSFAGKSYWLGSMSNSSSFNYKPNRDRLIAINQTGTGAAVSFTNAGYVSGLRAQLVAWGDANGYNFSASAADGKDSKLIDGFNAEGMVFAPDNTTLYIGFRAPLVPLAGRTKAVIAPIQNFETWFNNGSPAGNATIGTPIELDLGVRGIRDMIRLTDGKYIIVAGSYDGTSNPAIFRWSGNAADAPIQLSSFNLAGLNAEAAIGINTAGQLSSSALEVICDNGDNVYYADGVAAKDLPQDTYKKFDNIIITSSTESLLPVRFEYFTAQRALSNVQLSWKTGLADNAASFDVMRSDNGVSYSKLQTVAAINGVTGYSYVDINAPDSKLYYRINAKDITGQSYTSSVRIVNANGLQEPSVRLYPNPVVHDVFSLVFSKPATRSISIYNSAGILYKQISFSNTSLDISTIGWTKGYYLLRITANDGSITTEKVVIQ